MALYYKFMGYPIGRKHVRALRYWIPSLASYATAATIGIWWITDYRKVMKKVPWYNQRFLYPYEDDKNLYYEPRFTLDEQDNA